MDALPWKHDYLNGSTKILMPHRRDRVVTSKCNLFDETKRPNSWLSSYKNHHVNITVLFGLRCGRFANEQEKRQPRTLLVAKNSPQQLRLMLGHHSELKVLFSKYLRTILIRIALQLGAIRRVSLEHNTTAQWMLF